MDETPKGWYVQYIDRDPETIRRQEEQAKKKKAELDDEERSAKFIEEQVRRGRGSKETEVSTGEVFASAKTSGDFAFRNKILFSVLFLQETPVYTELKRENEEEKGLYCFSLVVTMPFSFLHQTYQTCESDRFRLTSRHYFFSPSCFQHGRLLVCSRSFQTEVQTCLHALLNLRRRRPVSF